MARIYVVRHGETAWNVEHRLQGHSDIPLSENGLRMACDARTHFKNIPFTEAYASDLMRAYATAEILVGETAPLSTAVALRERCFGTWEGRLTAALREEYGDLFEQVAHHGIARDEDGIESFASVVSRTMEFFYELGRGGEQSTILAVTHGGVMKALLHHLLLNNTPTAISIGNLAYFVLDVAEKATVTHLHGIAITPARVPILVRQP